VRLAILGVSLAAAAGLFVAAGLTHLGDPVLGLPSSRAPDIAAGGLLLALGPASAMETGRYRRLKRMEARLPDFFRELASGRKAGLTLPKAVALSAEGDFGALTPEIRRMSDQLHWNVPLSEVLHLFGERVRSPMVEQSVSLINEASVLGGNVSRVLEASARNLLEVKRLEDDRRTTMSLYTVIVAMSFFVFLAVIAALYGFLLPPLVHSTQGLQGGGFGLIGRAPPLEAYRTFFFVAALVQAVGGGIVAGVMGTGKLGLGLRHAFMMVAATLALFGFLLPPP
jgi:archaeal flagellar protein FlaJ